MHEGVGRVVSEFLSSAGEGLRRSRNAYFAQMAVSSSSDWMLSLESMDGKLDVSASSKAYSIV